MITFLMFCKTCIVAICNSSSIMFDVCNDDESESSAVEIANIWYKVSYKESVSILDTQGFLERASAPWCHFPGLYITLNCHPSVVSLSFKSRGFAIESSDWLLNIPSSGLWSTAMNKSLQPSVNKRECFKAQERAKTSPSVGE